MSTAWLLVLCMLTLKCISPEVVSDEPQKKAVKALPRSCDKTPSSYNISLDDAPADRWRHVLADFTDLADTASFIVNTLIEEAGIRKQFLPILLGYAKKLHDRMPASLRDEINGIALQSNISVAYVTILNVGYDLTAFCTSVVAADSNGIIWHGRNMDYNSTDILRNMTIQVNFQRSGQTVFSGVTFVGYIGLVTGIKPNAFTLSINERDRGAFIDNFLELLDPKMTLLMTATRHVFEATSSFSQAVKQLSKLRMPAPVYLIIGGISKDEGVVITRERTKNIDIWPISLEAGRWYVLQTNYDHWLGDPWWDNRRTPGEKAMNASGETTMGKENMFKVLSVPLVKNQYTVYTTVMSASNPTETETWIRCNSSSYHTTKINNPA